MGYAVDMNQMEKVDELRLAVSSKRSRTHKAKLGQFMTPSSTARFMASLFQPSRQKECRLLDPGAGIGSLSSTFLERCSAGDLKFTWIDVTAFELDTSLHEHLDEVLAGFRGRCGATHRVIGGDFIEQAVNAIQFRAGERFTHAIMNPPYKKINTGSRHRLLLRQVGIETVNLYSGFVALVVALMENGGEVVAIIPRSWCNGPYYRPFREFVLERAALTHIHVFGSRRKAFKDDDVLQETIIVRLVKGQLQGDVTLSTSEGGGSFSDIERYVHPFERVVHRGDEQKFIHIPLAEALSILSGAPAFAHSLSDLGIDVCTGPVVDFRLKAHLRQMPETGDVPLLYANHLTAGAVEWPIAGGKKPNCILINDETKKWLMPMGTYAVTRRFSSKEEKRRVMATVVDHTALPDGLQIGFENHLNVFHRHKAGLPSALAYGLVVYLNSAAVDEHLRRFSGHTQINATDLRKLPYPSEEALLALGEWAIQKGAVSQENIDAKTVELASRK
jgi:tRNA1(Val) A37 N6-methylase TrmN6